MDQGYQFYRPKSIEDYNQFYRVMDLAFKDEDVSAIVRRFVEKHPDMTDDNYFAVKDGSDIIGGLVLIPQKWVIDGVELNVAEMGCVGTNPKYRRKGVQKILNDKFDEYAKEMAYDLCVLAGIPYFYRQFGYQYAVELDYISEIKVAKLPINTVLKSRTFEIKDVPMAQSLLEETQERYLIRSLRTPDIWKMQQETGTYGAEPFRSTVIQNEEEIVAYMRVWVDVKEKTLVIRELAKSKYITSREIAAIIRAEAEKNGLKIIKTKLSHIDDFSKYLIGLGAKTNKPYAWQVKILNPRKFLEKLGPTLERRIEASKFKGFTKELRLNFWKYALSLRFEDGNLISVSDVAESGRSIGLNPYASIQLFLGFRSREDLEFAYPDFYVRDGFESLIDVLFPRKPSYIHYCY